MPHVTSPPALLPRLPLIAVGCVLVCSLGLAAIGQRAAGGATPAPTAPMLAERSLSFTDRADHAVVVSENGREVAVFEGEQGFLRGILRGLNRTRRARDIAPATPFHLAAYTDGRLTLDDPATGIRLDLAAFGSTNEEVFAAMLPIQGRQP